MNIDNKYADLIISLIGRKLIDTIVINITTSHKIDAKDIYYGKLTYGEVLDLFYDLATEFPDEAAFYVNKLTALNEKLARLYMED